MSKLRAHIDFETKSTVDLRKSGVYAYASHWSTGIWCLAWRIGAARIEVWEPGEPFPDELFYHVRDGETVVAHNMQFDRTIWNRVLRRMLPQIPALTIEQTDCTMARAYAVALPGQLEKLTGALGMTQAKDMEGHALMLRMMRPRKVNADGSLVWWEEREKIDRLKAYCKSDVEVESIVDMRVPQLQADERAIWIRDQQMNERGVQFDDVAASRLLDVTETLKLRSDAQMKAVTGGAVKKVTQVKQLAAWLNTRGVACTSVGKGAMVDLKIEANSISDVDALVALMIREENGKSSTAKLKSGLACQDVDGRMRGLTQYHGTTTSRWAGRLYQPQNIQRLDAEKELDPALRLLNIVHQSNSGDPVEITARIEHEIGPAMPWISKAQRPLICASPRKKLIGGDFSNIEGRMNAWYAGEHWKLDAFRAFDQGVGEDLYKLAYSKSFGVPTSEIDKPKRQIGKVEELALGFQGSVGAFVAMGATYGVRPEQLAKAMRDVGTYEERALVAEQYRKERNHRDLTEEQWKAAKLIVNAWRKSNPAIVQGWWDIQDAAIAAVSAPGTIAPCYGGKARYLMVEGVLWCQVASGKMLAYQKPSLRTRTEEYVDKQGVLKTREKRTVFYWAYDGEKKRWAEFNLYGGLQCENIISKTSRDLLVDKMFAVEEYGYPVVLTVHDELVSEVDKAFGTPEHYEQIMSVKSAWLDDQFPLAVAAWEGERYGK